ncbi:MAG: hypothetical protein CMF76_08515 [Maricaulis sp.]|nr:hypothetical protein [Maricaulis sp.]|tara:strand:+ start:148 stop:636 length:489 start_codon:yes stop_codon:yes gene_type:complete
MESPVADYSSLASAIIAGLALLVSLVALVLGELRNARQKKFVETQHELNERLLARELQNLQASSKADMGAKLIRMGKSSYRVKVWNQGEAVAHNVDIRIPEGTNIITEREVADKFPMEFMERHNSVELLAFVHMQTARKQPIEIVWSDDDGQNKSKIVYLTF